MIITQSVYADYLLWTSNLMDRRSAVFYRDATPSGGSFFIWAIATDSLAINFVSQTAVAPQTFASDFPDAIAVTSGALGTVA